MARKSLINELDFQDINNKASQGQSIKEIAKDYGVSYQVMYNTIKKRIPKWADDKTNNVPTSEVKVKAAMEKKEVEKALKEQGETGSESLKEMAEAAPQAIEQLREQTEERMCKRYLLARIQSLMTGAEAIGAQTALALANTAFDNYSAGDFELALDKTLRAFHHFNLATSKLSQ